MTTLEIAHSRAQEGPSSISELLTQLKPCVEFATDYTFTHRTCLVRPLLNFDSSAFALSFVPAAGERNDVLEDSYTYLHLRRDIFEICRSTGTPIASRYALPSCHLTIGRFVSQQDFDSAAHDHNSLDHGKVRNLIRKVDEVNDWLKDNYWPKEGRAIPIGGVWEVGEEQGLEARRGTCWYGGGQRVHLGRGF